MSLQCYPPGAVEKSNSDGHSLQYAPDKLKADKEVVLEAVEQNETALECASFALHTGGLKAYADDPRWPWGVPAQYRGK